MYPETTIRDISAITEEHPDILREIIPDGFLRRIEDQIEVKVFPMIVDLKSSVIKIFEVPVLIELFILVSRTKPEAFFPFDSIGKEIHPVFSLFCKSIVETIDFVSGL